MPGLKMGSIKVAEKNRNGFPAWAWRTVRIAGVNANPGSINPWLINRGVSPFSGDSDHFWRVATPLILGRVLLRSGVGITQVLVAPSSFRATH